jgi:hypothetical protein
LLQQSSLTLDHAQSQLPLEHTTHDILADNMRASLRQREVKLEVPSARKPLSLSKDF